ncbi:MAG TPA: hypothetical protein VFK25_12840, partial [Candidatus Binatia bacterium]|nr:hypothetical protein [Candidatus Binatia bacterium]
CQRYDNLRAVSGATPLAGCCLWLLRRWTVEQPNSIFAVVAATWQNSSRIRALSGLETFL